ncbi:hypothetical protein N7462_005694 [Penicillium macrosclerotiorum]|uniref:uncharacterized protein n=1 Tax=Penicillium macrosclerotiorum TaxID=303699 RepID=UPI002547AC20|nr:uncharacterized protein N7462_005694 [Penicillium macrosclerotiorum]KAJ5682529.1 hypothetical protein N7462_005694 [Penicillium macrosclerotiorum]
MSDYPHHVAILGAGTIGLSMIALHLRRPDTHITVYDPRPNYEAQLRAHLPSYLEPASPDPLATLLTTRLTLAPSLPVAVQNATIIHEQTPETTPSKQALWAAVAAAAPPTAHLWSSSSGIPPSTQVATTPALARRLLVTHPFNPPHLMPLIELVPSPATDPARLAFAEAYFRDVPGPAGARAPFYRPVTLRREVPGFVGNRLAFALLREACSLVGEGVVSVAEVDTVMKASLGPRWAGSGVFESYHGGGGEGGHWCVFGEVGADGGRGVGVIGGCEDSNGGGGRTSSRRRSGQGEVEGGGGEADGGGLWAGNVGGDESKKAAGVERHFGSAEEGGHRVKAEG